MHVGRMSKVVRLKALHQQEHSLLPQKAPSPSQVHTCCLSKAKLVLQYSCKVADCQPFYIQGTWNTGAESKLNRVAVVLFVCDIKYFSTRYNTLKIKCQLTRTQFDRGHCKKQNAFHQSNHFKLIVSSTLFKKKCINTCLHNHKDFRDYNSETKEDVYACKYLSGHWIYSMLQYKSLRLNVYQYIYIDNFPCFTILIISTYSCLFVYFIT